MVHGRKSSVQRMPERDELRAGVITISDRSARGERPDQTGPLIGEILTSAGWTLIFASIVPDNLELIKQTIVDCVDTGELDVLFTAGGTGFGVRDVTPEATSQVIERSAPGLAEAMRARSLQITPHAMLSRGVAGIRGRTLIVNLPGSPKAAQENLDVVLPVLGHAVQLLRDDPQAEMGHILKENPENG